MCQPSSESRSILLLHPDKLHAHAFFGLAPAHDGARPYLPCRYIKQLWMKVPGGGGSGVRMYNPPNARWSTDETTLLLAVCQAKRAS
jgi:hypothetical protein